MLCVFTLLTAVAALCRPGFLLPWQMLWMNNPITDLVVYY
ncbi:Hypothetical protein Cp4202_1207 [Corynebacterium pseudotuberculosis 42/02-A]|nr:Hypothetical protein Cp4202_1207 [Corynebacterium pseudotuberculosis 42/02-A]